MTTTTYNYNGKTIKLTQEPYIAGTNDNAHYEASAVDADDAIYLVSWDIILDDADAADCTDESNMCAWDNPSAITKL